MVTVCIAVREPEGVIVAVDPRSPSKPACALMADRICGFGHLRLVGAFAGDLSDSCPRVEGATAVEDDEEEQEEDDRDARELDHRLTTLEPHLTMSVCDRLSVMLDPIKELMNGVIGANTYETEIFIGQPLTRLPSQPVTTGAVIATFVVISTPLEALTAALLIPGSSNGFMPAYRAAANDASRIERSKK